MKPLDKDSNPHLTGYYDQILDLDKRFYPPNPHKLYMRAKMGKLLTTNREEREKARAERKERNEKIKAALEEREQKMKTEREMERQKWPNNVF